MILHIKNMVCNRCIMVVEQELKALGINASRVDLGEAEVTGELSLSELRETDEHLQKFGFELIDDRNGKLIEKIKKLIIQLVHYSDGKENRNLSDYIQANMNRDYTYLSNLFSTAQGITLEKYFILQKIERVKELLVYDELNLSEIADMMGYSSVSYLSNQFKKVTGLTPLHFKRIGDLKRKPLDKV